MSTEGERLNLRDDEDLSPEEFRRRIETPFTPEERDETHRLIAWFMRRYPTPLARLRYIRRKYKEWTRKAVVSPRTKDPKTQGPR